jgi:hypothetical protein
LALAGTTGPQGSGSSPPATAEHMDEPDAGLAESEAGGELRPGTAGARARGGGRVLGARERVIVWLLVGTDVCSEVQEPGPERGKRGGLGGRGPRSGACCLARGRILER